MGLGINPPSLPCCQIRYFHWRAQTLKEIFHYIPGGKNEFKATFWDTIDWDIVVQYTMVLSFWDCSWVIQTVDSVVHDTEVATEDVQMVLDHLGGGGLCNRCTHTHFLPWDYELWLEYMHLPGDICKFPLLRRPCNENTRFTHTSTATSSTFHIKQICIFPAKQIQFIAQQEPLYTISTLILLPGHSWRVQCEALQSKAKQRQAWLASSST